MAARLRIKTHPGKILREEFLAPLDMSARSLAAVLDVPPNRVTSILNETRSVTADTAIRLGKALGTTSEFWLNLQQAHDLSKAEAEGDFTAVKRVREIETAA